MTGVLDQNQLSRHLDHLHQNVHYSLEYTSNPFNDYYYSYEPVTPVQDVAPVLQTPPRPLEEGRRYTHQQHCPPDRFIHGNY